MEHSYSRDCRLICGANGLITRTLMVHRPPHCPSCQIQPMEDNNELDEASQPPIPSYDEILANESMNECLKTAESMNNNNSDDENWEERLNKNGWTTAQEDLFSKIVKIFDQDQLACLATLGKQHEPIQKRVIVDKSVQRVRKVLSSVAWDSRLTQWLHCLLMECLPPTYIAIYLNILQTLKSQLTTLVDKMMFGKPVSFNQDLLVPILKKPWEPIISPKVRKLVQNTVFVVIPNNLTSETISKRTKNWRHLLSTVTQTVLITIPVGNNVQIKQTTEQVAEQIVSLTRLKIQELRNEQPFRPIVLIGFNAGASLVLQVALSENVSSIVCMGFAYNTVNGPRGDPDDHILSIKTPILFVVGQNSARTSHEEMESIREKMHSETSLVSIGSADDLLTVPKSKRKLENVTQNMVDDMVMDEVFEFVNKCLTNPPGPRQPVVIPALASTPVVRKTSIGASASTSRKRKISEEDFETSNKIKYSKSNTSGTIGRPRTRPLQVPVQVHSKPAARTSSVLEQPSNEDLNRAIESILGDDSPTKSIKDGLTTDGKLVTTYEIVREPKSPFSKSAVRVHSSTPLVKQFGSSNQQSTTKIKMLPSNQFVQLKPPIQSQSKIYTIKRTSMGGGGGQSATNNNSGIATTIRKQSNQVFTIKSPSNSISQNLGPSGKFNITPTQKFTLKSASNIVNLPIVERKVISTANSEDAQPTDISSIFDMPILFADNDGNIQDNISIAAQNATSSSGTNQYVIESQPKKTIGKNTFVITNAKQTQSSANSENSEQKPKQNRMVYINRNSIRPYPNIISKTVPPLHRYSKVVVTNSKPKIILNTQDSETEQSIGNNKITNPVKRINLQKFKPLSNVQSTSNFVKIKPSIAAKQFKPIVIIDKIPISSTSSNVTKAIGDPKLKTQPIVLKSGTIKPIPINYKPTIINRNLTVRKVVNIVPHNLKPSNILSTAISKLKTGSVVPNKTVMLTTPVSSKKNIEIIDEIDSSRSSDGTTNMNEFTEIEISNVTSSVEVSENEEGA